MSEEVRRRTSQADAQIKRHGPEGQEVKEAWDVGCKSRSPG